jgi:pimeloyl-ACP methyl ester carboxylesterase
MQQTIYCIPGLAADHRMFERLKLKGYQLAPLAWLMPKPNESLPQFAARMAAQIPERHPILLGVSFGGMLATEISKLSPCTTLVVSSCKGRPELPAYLRLAGNMHLHKAISFSLAKNAAPIDRLFFDPGTHNEEIQLKRAMLRDSDNRLLHRSVAMIMRWKNTQWKKDIYHLHGTHDRLLTPRSVKASEWIEAGTHFMIWNKPDEVSRRLIAHLENKKAPPEFLPGNA